MERSQKATTHVARNVRILCLHYFVAPLSGKKPWKRGFCTEGFVGMRRFTPLHI